MARIKFVFVVRLSARQHLASDCLINLHQGIARVVMHPSISRWMNSASAVNRNLQLPLSLCRKLKANVSLRCNPYSLAISWGNPIALQHFSFYGGAARREKKLRRPSARNGAEMSGKRASDGLDGWMDVTCILPRASIDLPPPSHRPPVFHTKISTNKGHKVRGKC